MDIHFIGPLDNFSNFPEHMACPQCGRTQEVAVGNEIQGENLIWWEYSVVCMTDHQSVGAIRGVSAAIDEAIGDWNAKVTAWVPPEM